MSSRILWFAVVVSVSLVGAGISLRRIRQAESTPALRGEAHARELGCFSCHGPEGRGGVADPGSRNGMVPGWDGPTVATLAENEAEVREWILDGRPARLKKVAAVARREPLIPMPAYRDKISAQGLDDLMVYFKAVSAFGTAMPEPVYEGWKIADRLGCFGCHGPAGIGGSPNPGSFKGHIPAWDGKEFPELVRDEDELREWILDGKTRRLWDNPAARYFLERQLIQMPGYRRHLSDAELTKLAAYIQWLRQRGDSQPKEDEAHKIIGFLGTGRAAP